MYCSIAASQATRSPVASRSSSNPRAGIEFELGQCRSLALLDQLDHLDEQPSFDLKW